jgi:ATP sulfurylase
MYSNFRLDYNRLRVVRQRQLCDLELIINGGFSPLEGFMNQADYDRSVILKNVVGARDQTKLSAAWSRISG